MSPGNSSRDAKFFNCETAMQKLQSWLEPKYKLRGFSVVGNA